MKTLRALKIIVLGFLLFFSSCSDDFWFDFLLGPQPNILDDKEFTSGLNILGILRPDSLDSKPMSYVLVEKLIAAVNEEPDSFNIIDAQVSVYEIYNDQIVDTFIFIYDSTQLFPSIYRPIDIEPKAGVEYRIECFKNGLPTVTAKTVLPDVPSILNNQILVSENLLEFSILYQNTAEMFDVYLVSGSYSNSIRVMQNREGNTAIKIGYSGSLSPEAYITIYAFDANLSQFLTAPNIFIKPNTYRPPFTTVTGGYGCFGSLNLIKIPVY